MESRGDYRDFLLSLKIEKVIRAGGVFILTVMFLVACLPFAFGTEDYTSQHSEQEGTYRSYVPTKDDGKIVDSNLDDKVTEHIGNNPLSMVCVFGQCYGGGFIDDFDKTKYDHIALMSASRHDQTSWGGSGRNDESYFLKALADAIEDDPSATIKDLFYIAEQNDEYGPNGEGEEDPQFLARNQPDADNIRIGESATKNWAVLYAGKPDKWRHWNNLDRIYDILKNLYGISDDDILVLYGDKKDPDGNTVAIVDYEATSGNLNTVLENIGSSMDSSKNEETLFLWISDHGGRYQQKQNNNRGTIQSGSFNITEFNLSDTFIDDLRFTSDTPYLYFNHSEVTVTDGIQVSLNGQVIGYFSTGTNLSLIHFDARAIDLSETSNEMTINNTSPETVVIEDFSIYAISVCERWTPQWDVTDDGFIGIDDIFRVAVHFGASKGMWNYDAPCDVQSDGYIGIDDIFSVAVHFGEDV